jgi:hypothetical protein
VAADLVEEPALAIQDREVGQGSRLERDVAGALGEP